MATCQLDRRGDVFVLTLCDDENRFDPDTVGEMMAALDEAATAPGRAALVTTGQGKFYSNGLALDWMMAGVAEGDPDRSARNLEAVYGLLNRVLTFPMPTVAAVNGHWFGAGALLGLAHDRRVVRSDRGWFCMPEATMGMGIARPLMEVLRATLPLPAYREILPLASRVTAHQALAFGFADEIANDSAVLDLAVAWAEANANDQRKAVADIKREMYRPTVEVLEGRAPGSRDHQPASTAH